MATGRGGFSAGHSGGGSRGGGISFGRGGFSSSSRSGGHGGPPPGGGPRFFHGPMHFHWFGRPVVVTTGKQAGFVFGIILLFIAVIGSFITGSNYFENLSILKSIQNDSKMCIEVRDKALAGASGYHITTAYFEDKYYDVYDQYFVKSTDTGIFEYGEDYQGMEKFYIVFSYTAEGETKKRYEQTFAQYLLKDIPEDGEIQIAYAIVDGEYVAINLDYSESKNTNLIDSKHYVNSMIIPFVVFGVIALVDIVIMIFLFARTIKHSNEEHQVEQEKKQEEVINEREKRLKLYCENCGTLIGEDDKKCPNCGSPNFVKK